LVVDVVARERRPRVVLPVARDGAVDDAGVPRPDRGVVQSEASHDAGPEAFDDHVRLAGQFHGPAPVALVLQIELEAALAAVDGLEQTGVVAHRIASRGLHLQRVGAQGHQK